jgi:hypothetical protein
MKISKCLVHPCQVGWQDAIKTETDRASTQTAEVNANAIATPPAQFETVMVNLLTVEPPALRVARRPRATVVALTLPPLKHREPRVWA